MRFILQLFYAPAIRTVPDAQVLTAQRREATASQRARFASFVDAAMAIEPNLFVPKLNDAVLAVTMPQPPREQVIRLARTAAMAGLHLLDPQNNTLYRADGCVVYANGSVAPMPSPPACPPAATSWSKTAVQAHVSKGMAHRLSAHGFQVNTSGTLARHVGAVDQGVHVVIGEQAGAMLAHPRFFFQCRDVWQVWHDALGQTEAVGSPDLTLTAVELADGTCPSHQGNNAWRTMQEVDHWLDSFESWFVHDALPRLDGIQRAADLAAVALTDAQMQELPRRPLSAGERFSRMVLAAAFDAERLPTWASVLCTPRPNDGKVERGQLKQLADFLQG